MSVHLYRPVAPLAQFVETFWHWDGQPAPTPRERTLPTGTSDLIINLDRDRITFLDLDEHTRLTYAGAVLCGAQAGYRVFDATAHCKVMGVHFKPAGAWPFMAASAAALGGVVDLEWIWGKRARDLHGRLIEAGAPRERFQLLERALLTAARRTLELPATLTQALCEFEDPSLISVSAVNARTGTSAKRLIALFREHVGLTPKAYWRVRRFQAALRALDCGANCSGVELSLALGYYDQAHFIHEFQALAGMSPSAYLKHERWRPNHVPMPG